MLFWISNFDCTKQLRKIYFVTTIHLCTHQITSITFTSITVIDSSIWTTPTSLNDFTTRKGTCTSKTITKNIFLDFTNYETSWSAQDTLCTSDNYLPTPPPPPKKKGPFLGGYVFLDFFYEFLRWGKKILHDNSRGLTGPFGRILAGQMPFPATNLVLNFIFLQKFLQFCSFLDIFCSKCQKVTKSPQSI